MEGELEEDDAGPVDIEGEDVKDHMQDADALERLKVLSIQSLCRSCRKNTSPCSGIIGKLLF